MPIMALPSRLDVLFLSPHPDDVALSCAGTLHQLQQRGVGTGVLTAFMAPPSPTLALRPLHAEILLAADRAPRDGIAALRELWAIRRQEDCAAMALLQTAFDHGDLADAVLRPETVEWEDVFTPLAQHRRPREVRAVSEQLTAQLDTTWRSCGQPQIVAPLAVGSHIDHQLCFLAAEALQQQGAQVWFYEDYPYAAQDADRQARLCELGPKRQAHLVDITAELPARLAAIRCYGSQLSALFPAPVPLPSQLAEFASRAAEPPARYGERFWLTRTTGRQELGR